MILLTIIIVLFYLFLLLYAYELKYHNGKVPNIGGTYRPQHDTRKDEEMTEEEMIAEDYYYYQDKD